MLDKDDLNVEIQAVKRAMRKNKGLRMYKRYMVILMSPLVTGERLMYYID